MRNTTGWQSQGPATTLRRARLQRRELRPDDLAVRVDYCGVCHSDLHAIGAGNGAGNAPVVPGHEFTGTVTEIGHEVTRFAVGDGVAVGNIASNATTSATVSSSICPTSTDAAHAITPIA